MEPLMFPSEPVLLVAPRAFGVIISIGSPSLGSQRLVSLLVFFGDFVMGAPMLPPAVMSKGQGAVNSNPTRGKTVRVIFFRWVGIR